MRIMNFMTLRAGNFVLRHVPSSEPTVDYASFLSSSLVGDHVNISSAD